MNKFVLIAIIGLLCICGGDAAAQGTDSAAAAACRACHAERFPSVAQTPHAALESAAWQELRGDALSCAACHGDATEHIGAGGRGPIFAFTDNSALQQAEVCSMCHADDHPRYAASEHARAGMACTDCHSMHSPSSGSGALLKAPQRAGPELSQPDALCADCHQASFAEFDLNERHRIEVIDCTSCHNPHAPQTRSMLGGFKQQECAGCHLDKEGPFVFEHDASRVEGCTACHSAHGSPNRHLLTHQRTGELCYTCHANVPQFHSGFAPVGPPRFDLDTQCTNCHVAIHGSNLDPGFLR